MVSFKDAVLAKQSDAELVSNFPGQYLRYFKAVQHLRNLDGGTRRVRPELVVFIGRPGVGKTTRILSEVEGPDGSLANVCFQNDPQWWDAYKGQKLLVLDDFRGWIPIHVFLKLIDVVPLQLPIKGGFTPSVAVEKVYISSNFMPIDWWKDLKPNQYEAITRRISKVVVWDEDAETWAFDTWQEFVEQDGGTLYHDISENLKKAENSQIIPPASPVL